MARNNLISLSQYIHNTYPPKVVRNMLYFITAQIFKTVFYKYYHYND